MSDNLNIAAIIPLIITAVVAVVGWFIVHELSISRDIKNKRIELKIKYLIEAYRRTVSLDPLLGDLHEDLRKLLHLEHLQGPPIIIRWKER